jgi:transmembrane sensor
MEERLRYLFQRYVENNCSKKELEEFFAIIRRSGQEIQLRQLIRKVYNEIKDNPLFSTYVDENGRLVLTEPEWISSPSTMSEPKTTKFYSRLLVAAAIILVAGAIWLIKDRDTRKQGIPMTVESLTRKETDRAESKFLMLADSTKVWLNGASSLEFPDQFNSNKREVYLKGEAFFDVRHAERTPFIIHTGDVSTTVLGTAFNIKAYPGQKNITVSVSRGKVKVTRKDGWETTLTMGQQVKVGGDKRSTAEKSIPVNEIAAWQQGDIVFDDESVDDIITDMKRIYNAEIQMVDETLKELKLTTSFRKEIGVEQALQVLCQLTDTELKLVNGVYLIQ